MKPSFAFICTFRKGNYFRVVARMLFNYIQQVSRDNIFRFYAEFENICHPLESKESGKATKYKKTQQ